MSRMVPPYRLHLIYNIMDELKTNTSPTDDGQQGVEEQTARRQRFHSKPPTVRNTVFYIRQVLNVLFMLTAIVGAMMYCGVMGQGVIERQGIIVIIIAVSIKMAECMLRFKK